MNIFWSKREPERRRRTKKSHKWLDQVKAEAESLSTLAGINDDPIIKAAIMSRDNHFTITLEDFSEAKSVREVVYFQRILWMIEALQKQHSDYLNYAKRLAIQQGIEVIGARGVRHLSHDSAVEIYQEEANSNTRPVPPDIGRLMQEETRRRFPKGYPRATGSGLDETLIQNIRAAKEFVKSEFNKDESSLSSPSDIVVVEVDDELVEMTWADYEIFKRDREKLIQLKKQASGPGTPPAEE